MFYPSQLIFKAYLMCGTRPKLCGTNSLISRNCVSEISLLIMTPHRGAQLYRYQCVYMNKIFV